MRDKRFNCDTVLTVIKMYKYIVYVEIFVIVNCGARRNDGHHSKLDKGILKNEALKQQKRKKGSANSFQMLKRTVFRC